MRFLETAGRLARAALRAVIGVTIATLLAIMVLQIVLRYGFNASLIWAEEGCRYLLIWVSFLAVSAAYERGELASVTMVRDMLPRRAGLGVALAANAIGLALLCVLVWYGVRYAQRVGSQPIPALGFLFADLFGAGARAPSTFWVYLALPVGLALLAVRLLVDMGHYAVMLGSGGRAGDLRADEAGDPLA
jgi:TRAP-type C4-dicarboxylate transport system permease small subunit